MKAVAGRPHHHPWHHGRVHGPARGNPGGKGADGAPPYHVRFDDGHETILFPGGDFVVERPGSRP